MNWIKCESKKALLLKGQDGGEEVCVSGGDGSYANVCTVPTRSRIKGAFFKKSEEIRDI